MTTQADQALVKHFLSVIRQNKAQHAKNMRSWKQDLATYRGQYWEGDAESDETSIQFPYSYAFTDVLVSNIVPPNPACDVQSRRTSLQATAQVRSALINDVMDKDGTTSKLWRAATLSSVLPRSALKAVFSKKRARPRFRVLPCTRFWYDTSAEEWEDIRWFIEINPMTRAELNARAKNKGRGKKGLYPMKTVESLDFQKFPSWVEDITASNGSEVDAARDSYEYVVVYEIYDLVSKKLIHIVDGEETALLVGPLPYPTLECPFWLISYNDNLTDLGGFSDSSIIREPLERLNSLATLAYEHTAMSLPRMMVHKDRIDNPEKFVNAIGTQKRPRDAVLVETSSPKWDIKDVVEYSTPPMLSPDWTKMQEDLRQVIEFILALPAYSRGQVGNADVATELALVDTAQKTRNQRRQKIIYQAIEWMARAILKLFQLYLSEEEESQIYLKIRDDKEQVANLSTLGLEAEDTPWDYDYSAHPYNAAEDNSVVRLKKIEAFLQFMLGSPHVDARLLSKEILEDLGLGHLLKSAEAVQQEQAASQAGAPGAPGGDPLAEATPGMPQELADTSGGELPIAEGSSVEAPLPPASGGAIPVA